jgi:cytochrome P450
MGKAKSRACAACQVTDLTDFIPAHPPRFTETPSAWRRLQAGRKNFLAMWEEEAFETDVSMIRILLRQALLCNNPESVQYAFSIKNESFERKSPQMRFALSPLLGDGLFVSDGEIWRQRRKIITPIVHISQLGRFAPAMIDVANEASERWEAMDGQTVDVLNETAKMTAEIICRAVFGQKLGHDFAAQIVDGFSEYQRLIDQIDLFAWLSIPDWVPRRKNPKIRSSVERIHAVLTEVIEKCRVQKDSGEYAIIHRLFDARDESGRPLSDDAIRNEIAVLFMAGHETTANSLTWSWYLISQAPEAEAKLHHELERVLGGRAPTLADVPELIYTRAIFEEAMRLYPPVPILPREALVDEQFKTLRIPKGTLVFVVPWLLHRHKGLWDKPDHFVPERFLPDAAVKISKFAYVPFSIGPRVCAGLSFGLHEAILCLATLAQRFTLRLADGHEVMPVCRLTTRPDGGMPMVLQTRKRKTMAPTAVPNATAAACPYHHNA